MSLLPLPVQRLPMNLVITRCTCADCQSSEAAQINKGITAARASAWPMQGGLQSITNTTVRTPALPNRGYTEISGKNVAPSIPEGTEQVTTKTPSPKRLTIKIEPASGKENATASPQVN
jgi:hypothetical protein